MKKLLLAATMLLAMTAAHAQAIYPAGVPGCVARYPFSNMAGIGDTLSDASGNNNVGLLHDVTYTEGWRGTPNAAGKFNGSSSFASVPDAANLGPKDITMVALFRLDDYNKSRCQTSMILSKGYHEHDPGVYAMGITDQLYDNDCDSFSPDHQGTFTFLGRSVPASFTLGWYPVQLHQWYLMVSVYDSKLYSSYLIDMDSNNLLPYIMPAPSVSCSVQEIDTNSLPLTIGKFGDPNGPYWFNGVIDEIAIFNRGLSAQEIYKIYYFLFFGHPLDVSGAATAQRQISLVRRGNLLNLQASDGRALGAIMLYNLQGQLLDAQTINTAAVTLDISSLPGQIFFLKLARNNTTQTFKIAKF